MNLTRLVYSIDSKDIFIPIVYSKRANAPKRGSVFTARVLPPKNCSYEIKGQDKRYKAYSLGKEDYLLNCFENYTGYIKKNYEKPDLEVETGKCYRFEIVAGPYTRERHNFFYAIQLRKINNLENRSMNKLDAQTYILIQRLGEFLLGLGWNREIKKNYKLSNTQRNWDWFYKNFMQ